MLVPEDCPGWKDIVTNQGSRVLRVELWTQVGCMESFLCQPKQALVSRDLAVEHRME